MVGFFEEHIVVKLCHKHYSRKSQAFCQQYPYKIWGYWEVYASLLFLSFFISFCFSPMKLWKALLILFSSNPGHPFAAGLTLGKLFAVTVDDKGNETFATGVNLDRIQKVCLHTAQLTIYYYHITIFPWDWLIPVSNTVCNTS